MLTWFLPIENIKLAELTFLRELGVLGPSLRGPLLGGDMAPLLEAESFWTENISPFLGDGCASLGDRTAS